MSYAHSFTEIRDRPVAVFGAGTLGRRIALMFASRGGVARVYDPTAEQALAATEYVTQTLPGVIERRGSGEVGRAEAAQSVDEALAGAWLAVEAVPERLDIKIPLWDRSTPLHRQTPSSPPTPPRTRRDSWPSTCATRHGCATCTSTCRRDPTRST